MNSTLSGVRASGPRLGFTSLNSEIAVDRLPLQGKLPEWLAGSLLRNGPARFEVGNERYRHWFDGLAMLHRFTIADGNVSYANRFLRSPGFLEAERTGRIARSEFDTDPQRSLPEQIRSLFGTATSHNANVNVVPFGEGYLALTETPSPVAFHGTTLETRGVLDYDDEVSGQMTTAHALYDPIRRATFNVVTEVGRSSRYQIVRIEGGTLRRTVIASIPTDAPAYLHAFSATGRYIIVAEYPLRVRPLDLLLHRKPYIENYRWEPQRATRFHVVAKDGGALIGTYEAEAFFAFHHINAFEDGDTVVLDISAYDDAMIISDLKLERLLADGGPPTARASFRRYRLQHGRSEATSETIACAATELPSVARRNAGCAYRYGYGVDSAAERPMSFSERLVKIDVSDGSVSAWSAPSAFPGEPIFVARPGATDEDDGVLLSVVLDAASASSFLLILDARSLVEVARATTPHHIPFGFHGLFR